MRVGSCNHTLAEVWSVKRYVLIFMRSGRLWNRRVQPGGIEAG